MQPTTGNSKAKPSYASLTPPPTRLATEGQKLKQTFLRGLNFKQQELSEAAWAEWEAAEETMRSGNGAAMMGMHGKPIRSVEEVMAEGNRRYAAWLLSQCDSVEQAQFESLAFALPAFRKLRRHGMGEARARAAIGTVYTAALGAVLQQEIIQLALVELAEAGRI